MGYLRKFIALILSVAFCAALVIGIGVIFAVKNVNVTYIDYSGEYVYEYEEAVENLQKVKGSSLILLKGESVTGAASGHVAVKSYEKIFPCTLNVVIEERVESYAFKTDDGYDVYDLAGTKVRTAKTNVNNLDSSPNVLLEITAEDIGVATSVMGYFKEEFVTLRNLVKSVQIDREYVGETDKITINFHSGLKIVLTDFDERAKEKIVAAHEEYLTLSESEKLGGAIHVLTRDGAAALIDAVYLA